jgi:hypothetical protein
MLQWMDHVSEVCKQGSLLEGWYQDEWVVLKIDLTGVWCADVNRIHVVS